MVEHSWCIIIPYSMYIYIYTYINVNINIQTYTYVFYNIIDVSYNNNNYYVFIFWWFIMWICYNDVCIDKSLIHGCMMPAMLQLLVQHLAMQDTLSPYPQGAFWQQENTSLTDLLGISMNTMRYYVRSNQYNGMRQSYIHLFLFMTRKNNQGRSNIIAVRCCWNTCLSSDVNNWAWWLRRGKAEPFKYWTIAAPPSKIKILYY